VLAALNETSITQKVLAWQMSLQLLPRPETTGSLLFESTAPAQDSLFGPNPGPRNNLSSPNSQIAVADANSVTFSGQPVEPGVPRNIVELKLIAEANTTGSYELVLRKFDPENPDATSFWFEEGGSMPETFANSAPTEYPGYVLLGTIHVSSSIMPVPGDYTGDGVVDVSDFNRWKETFGKTVTPAGSGADGNKNSNIDAADYVVWRAAINSTATAAHALGYVSVPEPQGCAGILMSFACCIVESLCRATRNRPCLAGAIEQFIPIKGTGAEVN
jgi:hypothetical protein